MEETGTMVHGSTALRVLKPGREIGSTRLSPVSSVQPEAVHAM